MNKSPAFQWYPKDILASARVQMMSMNEECAYRRLIDFCWINGSVPSDPARAARLVGKNCTAEVAKVALEMFEPHPTDPDKLIHDRLEVERTKQESNSIARKKASEARWNKQGKSDENGKSGKPAGERGERDEADNQSGSNVKSKSDANGYANALQTDMQNDALHIATASSTSEENIKDGRKANTHTPAPAREEQSPPADPPPVVFISDAEKKMNKKQFAEHLKTEFAHLEDVDWKTGECVAWYQRRFARAPNRLEVKKWLSEEYEDVTAEITADDKPPWRKAIEECSRCDSRGLLKTEKGMQKCKHEKL